MSSKPQLDAEEIERYSRHLLLDDVGVAGQLKLKSSAVLVVGAGGLGSPVLAYLAAAGVGRIGVVDFDTVELSNLQRQIIHGVSDIGRSKAESAKQQILHINPHCSVDVYDHALTTDNALKILEPYDLVIDGTDNFPTRYLANDAAVILGKPYIYGSIFKFEGQVSVFNLNGGPNYRDLYPNPPPPGLVPSCAEAGVLGVLPGVTGCIQATEALKVLLSLGSTLSGRLLLYDALTMRFTEFALKPNPLAPAITSLVTNDGLCGPHTAPLAEGFERMSVTDVATAMSQGWRPFVLDVRSKAEAEIVSLDFTDIRIAYQDLDAQLHTLPKNQDILIHCKHGSRSGTAGTALKAAGFGRVVIMDGGIIAWAKTINPQLARY